MAEKKKKKLRSGFIGSVNVVENRLGNGEDELRVERWMIRRVIDREVEREEVKLNPGMNTKTVTQGPIRRTASPSWAIKEQQEAVEESKIVLSSRTELAKPQIVSRSRSLRKSRDFDFSPEALLSNDIDINNVNSNNATAGPTFPSYTALLLEDIQNFHEKSVDVSALSSSMSKACSIVKAVADHNSTTNQHQRTEVSFTSAAAKKEDLMEPSFEKYVTVKRGGSSLEGIPLRSRMWIKEFAHS
ncbi:unnamed protein product [Arabidopsis arenosa]|uniref:Uncharacterized protein n=1 Tax=Arabidopsis arenosa TaxID=38785 RepID=A0A8S2B0N5_ARAAE|nr:unnamed protein product [Arabidopsis arenosa]